MSFKLIFFQIMNNVVVFKKFINANFNGLFKMDVSKKWIYVEANHDATRILVNNYSDKNKQIFDCVFVGS